MKFSKYKASMKKELRDIKVCLGKVNCKLMHTCSAGQGSYCNHINGTIT